MKNKKSYLFIFAIVIISLLGIYSFNISYSFEKNTSLENNSVTDSTDTKTYTCPMHPEVISDKPGKCPKCGMDLILKKDENRKDEKKQKSHNKDNSKNLIVLFSTQNTQYSAEVESVTDEFFKDSSYVVSLKLASSIQIDSANVSLSILNNDSSQAVHHMELLNGKYSAKIKFKREGIHILKFTFNLISDVRTVNNFNFSFNTNVKNNNQADMEHNEGMMGMMGMGSTGFWILMGGVMLAMMAVIMVINTNK